MNLTADELNELLFQEINNLSFQGLPEKEVYEYLELDEL